MSGAPGPESSDPTAVYVAPIPCNETLACYDTNVSGQNILTSLIIDALIGLLCYFGFVLWRGSFEVYHGRLSLPGNFRRPPPLKLGGHWQLWSWLIPTWQVSDREFLASAGLDALVGVRVLVFGIVLFIPITILGVCVVLPVNYSGTFLATQAEGGDTSSNNLTHVFLRMTISNIENGSSALWVHFTILCIFVFWTFYLLLVFYEEHIAMQHTLLANPEADGTLCLLGNSGEPSTAATPEIETKLSAPSDATPVASLLEDKEAAQRTPDLAETDPKLHQSMTDDVEGSGSAALLSEDGMNNNKNIKNKEYDLWPVLKAEDSAPSQTRPRRAGVYAVLVLDEPARRFRVGRIKRALGYKQTDLAKDNSLIKLQADTDTMSSWYYWPKGAFPEESLPPEAADSAQHGAIGRRDMSYTTSQVEQMEQQMEVIEAIDDAERQKGSWFSSCCGLFTPKSKAVEPSMDLARRMAEARQHVVSTTFKRLFGDDFDRLVPIFPTKEMDKKLMALYLCQAKIARVQHALDNASKAEGWRRKVEKLRNQLQALETKETALSVEAEACRARTLEKTQPCRSFFAIFKSAKVAAMAAAIDPNPIYWRGFETMPSPDPENINFPTLQRPWWERNLRFIFARFFIVVIMLIPIGLISGAFSQLEAALCGGSPDDKGSLSDTWFCGDNFWGNLLRGILTGLLPSIIMSVYQMVILPVYVYACAQAESRQVSLSGIDVRCAQLFFHWNVWNFFLGALLGGTIFNGLRDAIANPRNIVELLGSAVPASSNFFITYVMYRALAMTCFRLFYPHACIASDIAKWFHVLPKPKTKLDYARNNPLRNCRFSRDIIVAVMSVYIASLGYCIVAPFILPFAMIYFCLMYFVWRYQQLYVYQQAYNLRGQMWRVVAHRIMACLAVMVLFTGAMFYVKKAWWQGTLTVFVVNLIILYFDRYLAARYDSIYTSVPVSVLEAQPNVELDTQLWVAPPLRPKAQGWFIEWGKAWQFWGAPRKSHIIQGNCKTTGVDVAIKRFEKNALTPKESIHAAREAYIASALRGESGVVQVFGYFEDDEFNYIVMELCSQRDVYHHLLSKLILDESFVAANVVGPLLHTLHRLHTVHSIVHRDIKPENVLLAGDGTVRLADFGTAIKQDVEIPFLAVGTLDFMAPEVLGSRAPKGAVESPCTTLEMMDEAGLQSYNEKADIWSVGATAYELLCGDPPFYHEDPEQTRGLILTSAYLYIPRRWKDSAFARFLAAAMTRDPALRPSAAQLLRHEWIQKHFHFDEALLSKDDAPVRRISIQVDTSSPPTPPTGSKPRLSGTKHAHENNSSADVETVLVAMAMTQLLEKEHDIHNNSFSVPENHGSGGSDGSSSGHPPCKQARPSWLFSSSSESDEDSKVAAQETSMAGEKSGHISRLKSALIPQRSTWLKKFSIRRGAGSETENSS